MHAQKGNNFYLAACLSWAERHCEIMNVTETEVLGSIVQVNYMPGSRQGLERIQESTTDKDLHVLWSIILFKLPGTARVAPPATWQHQNHCDYLDI